MTQFNVTIHVEETRGHVREQRFYWSVSDGTKNSTGYESTRLKAWRKACKIARDTYEPVR